MRHFAAREVAKSKCECYWVELQVTRNDETTKTPVVISCENTLSIGYIRNIATIEDKKLVVSGYIWGIIYTTQLYFGIIL